MRLSLLPLAVLAAALLSPLSLQAPVSAAAKAAPSARVIVTFKADAPLLRTQALAAASRAEDAAQVGAARAERLGARTGLGLRGGARISDRAQVVFASGMSSAQLARRLAADGDVESVVIDHRRFRTSAPNDPLYAAGQPDNPGPVVGQWYLRAPDTVARAAIDAESAWSVTPGRPDVVVAVLDTGVRFDHPDLGRAAAGGSLLPGYDMIADVPTAGDGDGRDADPSDPGDFVTAADLAAHPDTFANCTEEPSSWHGTQTASLVGALTGNGIGMASVGRNVRVLPVRVLGKCGGYDSDIQAAMRWAAGLHVPGVPDNTAHKASVINLSLGSQGACDNGYPAVVQEVLAAGVAIVVAAGNSTGHAVGVPANCPGVIAVAALRHAGTKVGFSDIGPQIALSAPGGNCINVGVGEPCLYPIVAATNAGATTPVAASAAYSDSWSPSVGTSFAAPLVAGTAALMKSAQPALTPADLRRLLLASARAFPTTGGDNGDGTPVPVCQAPTATEQLQCYCTRSTCGAGMLDAGAAVRATRDDAAYGVVAKISVSPTAPTARQAVILSAAGSTVASGRTIASVRWTITDGGGIADGFSGAADGLTVTVVPTAAGRFSVSASVTDNLGSAAVAAATVVVASGDPSEPPADPSGGTGSGGGGGGGATGPFWLLGVFAATVAVGLSRRRRR